VPCSIRRRSDGRGDPIACLGRLPHLSALWCRCVVITGRFSIQSPRPHLPPKGLWPAAITRLPWEIPPLLIVLTLSILRPGSHLRCRQRGRTRAAGGARLVVVGHSVVVGASRYTPRRRDGQRDPHPGRPKVLARRHSADVIHSFWSAARSQDGHDPRASQSLRCWLGRPRHGTYDGARSDLFWGSGPDPDPSFFLLTSQLSLG